MIATPVMDVLAIEKARALGAGNEWLPYKYLVRPSWSEPATYIEITGANASVYKRGHRKGQPKWLPIDEASKITVNVTYAEIEARKAGS
jgi:hypothetical protein